MLILDSASISRKTLMTLTLFILDKPLMSCFLAIAFNCRTFRFSMFVMSSESQIFLSIFKVMLPVVVNKNLMFF